MDFSIFGYIASIYFSNGFIFSESNLVNENQAITEVIEENIYNRDEIGRKKDLTKQTDKTEIHVDTTSNNALCENLYFQPSAYKKMQDHNCDIAKVESNILLTKKGIY